MIDNPEKVNSLIALLETRLPFACQALLAKDRRCSALR